MKDIFDNWIMPILLTGGGIILILALFIVAFSMLDMVLDESLSKAIKKWLEEDKK